MEWKVCHLSQGRKGLWFHFRKLWGKSGFGDNFIKKLGHYLSQALQKQLRRKKKPAIPPFPKKGTCFFQVLGSLKKKKSMASHVSITFCHVYRVLSATAMPLLPPSPPVPLTPDTPLLRLSQAELCWADLSISNTPCVGPKNCPFSTFLEFTHYFRSAMWDVFMSSIFKCPYDE